ncbi:hypothetical protein IV203_022926 [Nitzschia inconspicua]|uniref:Uncharacterized protein n=1 Tax=Nitzschia inconspicua TaxID=303405 RepID=A0A9K3PBL7_9STRA|nr:hypothetical protein IV203_022926 [Nitzschia inconspicua]
MCKSLSSNFGFVFFVMELPSPCGRGPTSHDAALKKNVPNLAQKVRSEEQETTRPPPPPRQRSSRDNHRRGISCTES